MIQRLQTVYLLLAAILLIIFILINPLGLLQTMDLLLVGMGGMAALDSLMSIFLYKNRASQLRVVYLAIGLTLGLSIYYIIIVGFDSFYNEPSFFLLPAILLLQLLAIRGIKADEALVKSSYRLR